MSESRGAELLRKAAESFAMMADPFSSSWLAENGVTLDECGDLSENVANAIYVYREAIRDPRATTAVAIARGIQAKMEYEESVGVEAPT